MRGTGYEAVVLHRKCPVTKQMQKMAIKIKNENEKRFKITILERILHITENKLIIETSPFFHE